MRFAKLVAAVFAGLSVCSCADPDESAKAAEPKAGEPETYGIPIDPPAPPAPSGNIERVGSQARSTGAPAPSSSAPPASPPPSVGPPPTGTCTVEKNADGFFWRTSSKSAYVAYVPASYDPNVPMRAIVGMHGCGDAAENFATWGMNPWSTRATQTHIGISISGETGGNRCWSKGNDDDKVLAAVDDLATCFWIDRSKVVVAGFSSGGELAYRVGLLHADSFAGILVENSGLYAAGSPSDVLLAGAAWKLNVAHRAHTSDSVFPISKVKTDWSAMNAAGFPLATSEVAGTHDGTSDDWANWLIPQSAAWVRPE